MKGGNLFINKTYLHLWSLGFAITCFLEKEFHTLGKDAMCLESKMKVEQPKVTAYSKYE